MLIEPRDPLIVRDGRPFTNSPGARARSLPFPLPQTLAGALRTRLGLAQGLRFPQDAEKVRSLGIQGPLLAEWLEESWRLLPPAPADAVLLGNAEQSRLYRLLPLAPDEGICTNLPESLALVGIPKPDNKGKPLSMPRFWYWERFAQWLLEPENKAQIKPDLLGHSGPQSEVRTHLKVDAATFTAEEGHLFQTAGLEFIQKSGEQSLTLARRLALTVWAEAAIEGIYPLGGERRLALWSKGGPEKPKPPAGLLENLKQHRAARVIFLTPAAFENAYLPQSQTLYGAEVQAVALGRAVVASGWDLEHNQAKPTRRLVPAGSVYFVKLPQWSAAEIEQWLSRIWMNNLADAQQDQLDGYGLAVVGSWTGQLEPMEVQGA